jgi:predicted alpha/beta-fold hydrolase
MRSPDRPPFADAYAAPFWLPGGHSQTIYPVLLPSPAVAYRRETIDTPDGDFWLFDWLVDAAPRAADTPLVVLFHGLEGGSRSHQSLTLMVRLQALGWRGVVPHFRGCGGEPNRLPRAYHSGDHAEIAAMLAAVRSRVDHRTPVFALGVSLGGSALLNWLGRAGAHAATTVSAAAAVSTPLDLMASGIAIDKGFNRLVYAQSFLRTLKPKAIAMERRFPGLLDTQRVTRAKTMWEFDDVTALLHGLAGTGDTDTCVVSRGYEIALPTLVINARNDPFVPGTPFPPPRKARRNAPQPADGATGLRHAAAPEHPLAGEASDRFLHLGTLNAIVPPGAAFMRNYSSYLAMHVPFPSSP